MKTLIIALLDKSWPPEHSFVDGMLADVVAGQENIFVRLCVSLGEEKRSGPRRYKGAACLPVMHPRRGWGRLLNFWVSAWLIWYLSRRERGRGRRVVVFVRNDPVYLLSASLFRFFFDKLVFQSSFPHEQFEAGRLKRYIARLMYKVASRRVDAVTAVSPAGLKRVRKIFPKALHWAYIPLLSDLSRQGDACTDAIKINTKDFSRPVFLYIGTHRPERKLDYVLKAIVQAVSCGAEGRFVFVGASQNQAADLAEVPGVSPLLLQKRIIFVEYVSRKKLPEILCRADVGLSLIPPGPIYVEASPTKVPEYMGAGLAVLASKGIPMQEEFVGESRGGILVDWDIDALADGFMWFGENRDKMEKMKQYSRKYAESKLQYSAYLPDFLKLVGSDDRGCRKH